MRVLRALTFHQPYAWATAQGLKRLDNRTWAPPKFLLGEYFAIHAGQTYDPKGEAFLTSKGLTIPPQKNLHFGAILALARLVEWVTKSSDPMFFGPPYVGWVLDPIYPLGIPYPMRGAQSLWFVPTKDATEIFARTPLKALPAQQLALFGEEGS